MANSSGVNSGTGAVLSDWAHVEQSIATILTTPIGSRVMRRDFGSSLPDLVDRKLSPRGVLSVYSAAAIALAKDEPRFHLTKASIVKATVEGKLGLNLYGTYYPRAHLGDYSIAESRTLRVIF